MQNIIAMEERSEVSWKIKGDRLPHSGVLFSHPGLIKIIILESVLS